MDKMRWCMTHLRKRRLSASCSSREVHPGLCSSSCSFSAGNDCRIRVATESYGGKIIWNDCEPYSNSIENGEDQGCGCGYFLKRILFGIQGACIGSWSQSGLPNINRLKLTNNGGVGAYYDLFNAKAKPTWLHTGVVFRCGNAKQED